MSWKLLFMLNIVYKRDRCEGEVILKYKWNKCTLLQWPLQNTVEMGLSLFTKEVPYLWCIGERYKIERWDEFADGSKDLALAMLESYITPLLMSYVDKYIKNLKPSDLSLSLWGGDVVLYNLELRLDVLEKVGKTNVPKAFYILA